MFTEKNIQKFERNLGGLKFAVLVISVFSIMMIIGTFLESWYGTDFANRVIYKKFPFMAVQACMFLSILFAAFLRLPPKKRLYGFYTIHAGLVTIGCGSLVTYMAGIDGNILLPPNEPTRNIVLPNDVLRITYPNEGRQITRELPYTAFKTNLDEKFEDLQFLDYLPYSENTISWEKSSEVYESWQSYHTSEYMISNPNVSQEFIMTLHPEAKDFQSSSRMGPLSVHYLPSSMGNCFKVKDKTEIVFWESVKKYCKTPTDYKSEIRTTKAGNRYIVIKENDQLLTFFPDLSPWPLDSKLSPVRDTSLRVFNRKLFEKSPNLFLFGKAAAFFDGDQWESVKLESKPVDLPWMGFQLSLLRHEESLYPSQKPNYVTPIQSKGAIIKGNQKSIKVKVRDREYWVTDSTPISLMIDGKKVNIEITKKVMTLPFEFVLKNFKMDKDPGTNSPASYESFVSLFTSDGPENHHIYMNNPLKYSGFTFYQASYSQNKDGSYNSTLSANVDQGRPIKYFGSILLVLGSLWHYYITRKKKRTKTVSVENNKEVLA
ncbi:MAG: cytochrome c biogenesis protein ResB [Bacteriovoracaceae bacterium]|nr:cytochrome c biogenesis protein ResB [Bacteriovoracaceae bacterium]